MSGDENKPAANGKVQMVARTSFSGPLPPPEILRGYESVLPGLADRIVKMAENQSVHRQRLESRVIWFDGVRSSLGLVFGLIIALAGIVAGTYLILNGNDTAGLASLIIPLGVIVSAFVYQKRKGSRDE
ncbi:MAG: DUF2335 domain-containing protein [Minisyncoccota bacterium]